VEKRSSHSSTDHYLVKKYLADDPDAEISELADDLGELQGYRKAADYEMDSPIPQNPNKVEELYLMAEAIVNMIIDKTKQASP